jgi:hypothetical protein
VDKTSNLVESGTPAGHGPFAKNREKLKIVQKKLDAFMIVRYIIDGGATRLLIVFEEVHDE